MRKFLAYSVLLMHFCQALAVELPKRLYLQNNTNHPITYIVIDEIFDDNPIGSVERADGGPYTMKPGSYSMWEPSIISDIPLQVSLKLYDSYSKVTSSLTITNISKLNLNGGCGITITKIDNSNIFKNAITYDLDPYCKSELN